jgi:hypothetical protein
MVIGGQAPIPPGRGLRRTYPVLPEHDLTPNPHSHLGEGALLEIAWRLRGNELRGCFRRFAWGRLMAIS